MPRIQRLLDIVQKLSRRTNPPLKGQSLLEWQITKIRLLKRPSAKTIYRGEVFWCELGENVGNEENKRRPCLIIQNQKGNDVAPTTLVAPITNATITLPIAVPLPSNPGDPVTGTVDLGQIRVVSKSRIKGARIAKLTTSQMNQVDWAIMKSLGVFGLFKNERDKRLQKETYANSLRTQLQAAQAVLNDLCTELGIKDSRDLLEAVKELKTKF